ncbi:MAG: ABC transporter ATP-binding protein [Desulfurococcaceae archaeon]
MSAFENAVEVRDLVKVYSGGVVALNGLSFTVKHGEVYALIGPNGSGKTTTLRIVATLLKPTGGYVRVYGVDVVKEPLKARSLIGYLPEEAGAYRDLSGMDFVRFMLSLRFSGRRLEEAVGEAIEISGLGEDLKRPVRTYSKGMKRILALSVVLAMKPRLLVLDEPTAGLDVEKALQVRSLVKKYNREHGITVLMSSHNMLEVEYMADRVGMIYAGRLIGEGTPEELKRKLGASNLEEVFVKLKEATLGGASGPASAR